MSDAALVLASTGSFLAMVLRPRVRIQALSHSTGAAPAGTESPAPSLSAPPLSAPH